MNTHEPTPMFETYNPVVFELDYGLLLKGWYELEKEKATDTIPHTVAHYISPQAGNVSISNECVAEVMQSYGMDVIPVCGDQLAEEEWIEEDLGLILEHQADSEAVEFADLIEEIKTCLHHLGWSYDGFVIEECDDDGEENISVH